MTLQIGAVTETVEVTAAPSIIDTQTTTVGATFDSELLATHPYRTAIERHAVHRAGRQQQRRQRRHGRANPSIAGGSGLENQYVVDGVNITNSGYGALGSYSIVLDHSATASRSTSSRSAGQVGRLLKPSTGNRRAAW
jgi:hypothetical protein